MKFLVDTSPAKIDGIADRELVAGQLITPLTGYRNAGGVFAIDNGAFSGFPAKKFELILRREEPNKKRCLFVTVPDIVGSARRTLEIWRHRDSFIQGWPLALVAQDGIEDLDIPWHELDAIFIGGLDPWKDSKSAIDIVKTAKTLGKHSHVGRVNTAKRFKRFHEAGADTCDGSGVAMYDHMLRDIERAMSTPDSPSLFDSLCTGGCVDE